MPGIKVADIAFGRLRAPDLDVMEEFLTHFGMVRAERTPSALYMRGTGPAHHIHVTEKGEAAFIGLAWHVADAEDLRRLATLPGASAVETVDEPGGGKRVRLREPNGYQIEVLAGVAPAVPIAVTRQAVNTGAEALKRKGDLYRLRPGASQVKRIGHGVMCTPKLEETVRWFRETLGLIASDDLYAGTKDNLVGAFSRCDRGEEYVDHHVFFCLKHERAGLNHLSFEVQDMDDVFAGHHYLRQLDKYEHMWGIGRHLLGSNVYDYWADPWGRIHEHWSDSDRLNVKSGSNLMPVQDGLVSQWGEPPPQKLLDRVSA
jgi:catechol 2,3-dioxygenase-like lactoylglutathione lyase family enzyme